MSKQNGNQNGKPNPLLNKSKSKKEWLETAEKLPTTEMKFTTLSDEEVELLYTAEDVKDIDVDKEIGYPGEFPYTRGIHHNFIQRQAMDNAPVCGLWFT